MDTRLPPSRHFGNFYFHIAQFAPGGQHVCRVGPERSGRALSGALAVRVGFAKIPGMSKIVSLPKPKSRISPKVREAVAQMVRYGASQVTAAKAAGMSRQGLGKALKRPEVLDLMAQMRVNLVAEADNLRSVARLAAYETALDLMLNSKDERIKARMVEFLASDGKAPQVAVHVDARTIEPPATGYRYTRPEHLTPSGETQPGGE